MINEEQRFEQIEAYLKGSMSSSHRQSFENELVGDVGLQTEIAAHRKADLAISYLNQRELKKKLKAIDSETPLKNEQASFRRLVIRACVAASVIIVAGFLFVLTTDYFDNESSLADLSTEYFVPVQQEIFKGNNASDKLTYSEQLQAADKLYLNGDYEMAIVEYKRLSQIDNTQSDLAEWNLAMSYLLSESHQSEFDLLLGQIISDNAHLYNERALNLKKELK
jgi:hypothetical protein